MGRDVNHALGSARRPPPGGQVRGQRGGGLMEGKGIAVTAQRCQRSDCPKPNLLADFLGRGAGE